jgi:HEAT repeat protein/lysophospholipase L1-like esterase
MCQEPAGGKMPTLYIVGDSTVKNGTKGQMGWGDPLIGLFDKARIKVENHAIGGRSSRTFQTEGRWDKILASARAGDFVLVQMGHNDGGPLDDAKRARGTLPGIGEETREIDNLITKKKEVVHTYGWYLRKYVTDARAKGMTPILCSPIPHCPAKPVEAGAVEKSRYVEWSAEVARQEKAHFIDLNRIILSKYVGVAPADLKAKYFTPADSTHTSPAGAELNAVCVAEGLRGLKDCPLSGYLLPAPPQKDQGGDAGNGWGLSLLEESLVSLAQDKGKEPKLPSVTTRLGVIELKDINEAIEYMEHELQWKRLVACASLARAELYPPRQAEVAKVLEKLLNAKDRLTAGKAADALTVWATRDQVPSLVAALEDMNPFLRDAMYEALGKLQDPRAVAPVAKALAKFSDRKKASRALIRMGPIVEEEVRKYLKDLDTAVREEAAHVLAKIGKTGFDDQYNAMFAGLTKGDVFAKGKALKWFTTADLSDEQTSEVARAVAPLLKSGNLNEQRTAAEVLEKMGTRVQVPAMLEALKDDRSKILTSKPLIRALARLKDDRAIPLLVDFLGANPLYRDDAATALIAMGPLAEPDVLPVLDHNDVQVRVAAAKVLREIGTAKSLKPLEEAIERASNKDKFKGGAMELVSTAKAAIKSIQARAK